MPVKAGGTCPVCGIEIDRRAQACRQHRANNLTHDPAHQKSASDQRWKDRSMPSTKDALANAVRWLPPAQ